jgi:hypothetical protein
MFRSKKLLTSATALIAVAIMMTGTFAWQQMISKTNEFIGNKTDITLHDDFDPETGAKDVYVENQSVVDVYVRVKLDEAMNLTNNKWRPADDEWQAHVFGAAAGDCGHENDAEKLFHDYFTWILGGQKYYMPADKSDRIAQDTTVYDGTEAGVKLTPNAEIIKIADYLAKDTEEQEAFIGWIYDTDGYAYWSQPLKDGAVTGLLLNKVNASASLKDTEYYYAIDVKVEAVDIKDIPMWTEGLPSVDNSGITHTKATAQGITAINIITALSQ